VPPQKSLSKSFFGLQPSGFRLSQAETFFYWSHSNFSQYNKSLVKNFQRKLIELTKIRSGDKGALSKTILFRSNSAKFWFSDATYNLKPYPKFRQKIEIQCCNIPNWHFDLNILKTSCFTYHVTKVRKELFHWTVSGSQNLILLANILTTNKSRVPNLLSFTIVFVEQKWKIDN